MARPIPPQEHDDVAAVVIGHQPLEAIPVAVVLPQGPVFPIKAVQLPDTFMSPAAVLLLQQIPVKLPLLAPLTQLSELLSHEQKLLARMSQHEGVARF